MNGSTCGDFEFRDRILVNQIADKLKRYKRRKPKSYHELEHIVTLLVEMRAERFHGQSVDVRIPQGAKFVDKFHERENITVSAYLDLLVPMYAEEFDDNISSVSQNIQPFTNHMPPTLMATMHHPPPQAQHPLETVEEDPFYHNDAETAAIVKLS